jgi:hypothetical protein
MALELNEENKAAIKSGIVSGLVLFVLLKISKKVFGITAKA